MTETSGGLLFGSERPHATTSFFRSLFSQILRNISVEEDYQRIYPWRFGYHSYNAFILGEIKIRILPILIRLHDVLLTLVTLVHFSSL
jgi:hypothetical protein